MDIKPELPNCLVTKLESYTNDGVLRQRITVEEFSEELLGEGGQFDKNFRLAKGITGVFEKMAEDAGLTSVRR